MKEDGNFYETHCPNCLNYCFHTSGYDEESFRRMMKCSNCGHERQELSDEEWLDPPEEF